MTVSWGAHMTCKERLNMYVGLGSRWLQTFFLFPFLSAAISFSGEVDFQCWKTLNEHEANKWGWHCPGWLAGWLCLSWWKRKKRVISSFSLSLLHLINPCGFYSMCNPLTPYINLPKFGTSSWVEKEAWKSHRTCLWASLDPTHYVLRWGSPMWFPWASHRTYQCLSLS